jgi:hypothetical protein
VNGVARGCGVTLLPYFDVVFASDKATFSADYARLGQIPEGFASHSFTSAGHLVHNVMICIYPCYTYWCIEYAVLNCLQCLAKSCQTIEQKDEKT